MVRKLGAGAGRMWSEYLERHLLIGPQPLEERHGWIEGLVVEEGEGIPVGNQPKPLDLWKIWKSDTSASCFHKSLRFRVFRLRLAESKQRQHGG